MPSTRLTRRLALEVGLDTDDGDDEDEDEDKSGEEELPAALNEMTLADGCT